MREGKIVHEKVEKDTKLKRKIESAKEKAAHAREGKIYTSWKRGIYIA